MRLRPAQVFAALAAVAALTLSACGGVEKSAAPASAPEAKPAGPVTVFAAASLNKAFPAIAKELLPGTEVTFSFEGSSTLVEQISQGAPADVFASADEKNMKKAVEGGLVTGEPKIFTSNVLRLIVPKGNPAKITGLDASLTGKKLVICAPKVPCGNATQELATKLGVKLTPVSEEQKVTDVRGKVESGEADAGLVYSTDAVAAGDKVEIIEFASQDEVINSYPIAAVKAAKNPEAAQAFIDAVLSDRGQEILAKYGFRKP